QEAVTETVEHVAKAADPVVLAGMEVHRRGLQDTLAQLIEHARLPVAATLTGKSVIGERHPAYLGIYEGAMGAEVARQRVEASDLLLLLGVTLNDVDLGIFTARLDPTRMVRASQDEVVIRRRRYPQVYLYDFLPALAAALPRRQALPARAVAEPGTEPFPVPGRPITKIGRAHV